MSVEYYDKIIFPDTLFPVKAQFGNEVLCGKLGVLERLTWHEETEIKLYRKGSAKLQIGNEIVSVREGDVVIVNPCEPHSTIAVEEDCRYDILMMNVAFWKDRFSLGEQSIKLGAFGEGRIRFNHRIRGNGRVLSATETLFTEIGGRDKNRDLAVTGVMLWLLACLFDDETTEVLVAGAANGADGLKKIQPALEYANTHYGKVVSLDTLAGECSLSPTYFSKLFKEVMRINPKDYLSQLRLSAAETLLSTTDKKITEIAAECAMEDVCYFNRWFKKNVGVTPGKFRKRTLNN